MRDLVVWLLISLGLVEEKNKFRLIRSLTSVATHMAEVLWKASSDDLKRVKQLRNETFALIVILLHLSSIDVPDEEFEISDESYSSLFDDIDAKTSYSTQVETQVTLVLENVKSVLSERSIDREITALPASDGDESKSLRGSLTAYKEMRGLISVEPFRDLELWRGIVKTLQSRACIQVLQTMHRSFQTMNPGSDPQNGEAKRQLFFFVNSLYNRWMPKPTSVRCMKTATTLTPHFEEEVAYSVSGLRAVGDEGVNVEGLLQV